MRNVQDVKKNRNKNKIFIFFFLFFYSQTRDNLKFIVVKVVSGIEKETSSHDSTFTSVYMTSALAHVPNCLALTELALLGELSVYIKKIGQARRVILLPKKGDPARLVTPLAESTFCFSRSPSPGFSCELFAEFCKEMYEELAPAMGSSGGWVTPLLGTSFLHVNVAWVAFIGFMNGAGWQHLTYNFKDLSNSDRTRTRQAGDIASATLAGMHDLRAFKTQKGLCPCCRIQKCWTWP